MRIGLLNNLRAGRNDAQVQRLLQFIGNRPDVIHAETSSADVVPEALADLARQEVDVLIVNGGDGTLQYALTEILGQHTFEGRVPMIAPLRGGRTNMTACDIGCDKDAVRGMAGLIEDIENGRLDERVTPRPVLRVRHGIDRESEYGMFFGLGVIHRAIELNHQLFDNERARKIQGAIGATMVTAGLVGRLAVGDTDGILSPDKVQVIIDGEPQERGEFYLGIASSLDRLFSGMRPFWGEGAGGVKFSTIAADAHRIPGALAGILRGKPRSYVTEENGYTSRNARRVELCLDCGFTVDGELFDPEPGRRVELTADHTVQFVRT
ncbi:MAG: diacylglycerol kinase family protein [Myxococcota bacterium]|nr:diacylglycerol kinase family protein [Myxococcota bacterium]